MDERNKDRFDEASEGTCERVRKILQALPRSIKQEAQEIRLRVGRPVSVCCPEGVRFVRKDGRVSDVPDSGCLVSDRDDLESSFRILCSYSVYSHENEIRNGFVTLRGGHRAGICGTAVYQNGAVSGLKDVSSINIRVAREIPGSADSLLERLKKNIDAGLLLAGPPSSGKTTLLRDIARQLSNGVSGTVRKVAVVDERGEIAGVCRGVPQNDVGLCCDVLDGYPKADGIMLAVRCLSPQIIICDEIGSEREAYAVEQSLNAGVGVIASIHAGSVGELLRKKQALSILATGAFASVAMLESSPLPGHIAGIYRTGDLIAETGGGGSAHFCGNPGGIHGIA